MRTLLVFALALIALPGAAVAQSSICSGLSQSERKRCLEEEVARGDSRTRQVDRNNRWMDKAKDATCLTRDFGGHLAGVGGYAKGGPAGAVAGHGGYKGATGGLDRALGNPHACTKRAR